MKVGNIGRIGAFFIALLLSTAALAMAEVKSKTISLDPPTQRVDGSTLPASEIKHYLITINGPAGQSELIMTGTKQQWTPPAAGDYTLSAATVDTDGRSSVQSNVVNYTAAMIATDPNPPTLTITLPIESAIPAREDNGVITVDALQYLDLSPGTDGKLWAADTVDGIKGLVAPDGVRVDDYQKNARIDYLVEATGGTYSLVINNYATDGLSDSVWVGLNGIPAPEINAGKPVFSVNTKRGQWADTAPINITLPAGQSVITLFQREPGYVVSGLRLTRQ